MVKVQPEYHCPYHISERQNNLLILILKIQGIL